MVTFLDRHNNYFTLMMLVIGIPVKLSYRLDFDISLMDVIEGIQEKTSQSEFYFNSCICFASRNITLSDHFHIILFLLCPEGESGNSEGFQQSHRKDSR